MNTSTLIGNTVTETEIAKVPAVPFTDTFHPVHHKEVIDAVRNAISLTGMDIVRAEYALAREGMQMFAVWDLNNGTDELCWSIGIRNSMNKSLALGITAGTRVFICENLAFDGEFIEFRRHTKGLDQAELEYLAFRSVWKMVGNLTKFQAWHEGLKEHNLSETDAKILLVEIMTDSVFPASKFSRFYELYFGGVYDSSLWGFHEAVTDTLKGSNLLSLPKKNKALNSILNQHIENRYADNPSLLGDFYEHRARYNQ